MLCIKKSFHEYLGSYHCIVFYIYVLKSDLNRVHRMHDYWEKLGPSGPAYYRQRSVFYRITFSQGSYVLVPGTSRPGVECRFYVRVYAKENLNFRCVHESRFFHHPD